MLNDSQKLTVKVAVRRAAEKGTEDDEIRKLASGMKVSESEVRTYWERISGAAPTEAAAPKPQKACSGSKKGRIFWTEDMLRQLTEQRDRGESVVRIAEMMGLDIRQVSNKISRLPGRFVADSPKIQALPAELDSVSEPETEAIAVEHSLDGASPAQNTNEPADEEAENPDYPIDMPTAMFRMAKLVHDNFSDNVIRIFASNKEHHAACTFEVNGTTPRIIMAML